MCFSWSFYYLISCQMFAMISSSTSVPRNTGTGRFSRPRPVPKFSRLPGISREVSTFSNYQNFYVYIVDTFFLVKPTYDIKEWWTNFASWHTNQLWKFWKLLENIFIFFLTFETWKTFTINWLWNLKVKPIYHSNFNISYIKYRSLQSYVPL